MHRKGAFDVAEVLAGLEPKRVFHYFEEICGIPHASYHEEQISQYLVDFAKAHGLAYEQDDLYNVIIIKEATAGYEQSEPMILQGHMDMVCEQESDCSKDMLTEGLELVVEGDDISAKGTTLGGDDGIAVAMALAILESSDIPHPRLEFVCTVSEEVGMEGASHLDLSRLQAKKMLNLDSEEEGVFLAGCAGGGLATVTYPLLRESRNPQGQMVEIRIDGLRGGHSGAEIHKGRGNANLLLTQMLRNVYSQVPFLLVTITGGAKDNAIPREASAVVCTKEAERFVQVLMREADQIKEQYGQVEPQMQIAVEDTACGEAYAQPMTKDTTEQLLALITELPNGVIAMSRDMEGLVETSLNLGILTAGAKDTQAKLCYCVRSSVETAFDALIARMEKTASAYGADFQLTGRYPAWEFVKESPLRRQMVGIYREMFGKEPVIDVMHAGVECGMIAQKIPGLDCVSIGPTMHDIHTPQERLEITSTARTFDFVCEILRRS